MTSLLIDIGNTHLKWGLDTKQGFKFGGQCDAQPDLIESLFAREWHQLKPETLLVSCVGNEATWQNIFDSAKSIWDIQGELLVSPGQGCGVTNAYEKPERLGSDRWAAMVAAFAKMEGPVCMVSCGTAVTLDVINGDGMHLGGLILPGYGLMLSCLQKGTRLKFNASPAAFDRNELGQTTESCIKQGTSLAISSMVNDIFKKLKTDNDEIQLMLTGGDAVLLQAQIEHDSIIDPHLVLQGLAIMARSPDSTVCS